MQQPPAHPSGPSTRGPDYVARARDLRTLIEAEAAKPENSEAISAVVIEAMRDRGLFWIMIPKSLGGGGESVTAMLETFEEVTSSDAGTGWSLMANSAATIVAAHYCSDDHVARMFGARRLPLVAMSFAPSGRAIPQGTTYRAGARYSFGTGITYADWVAGTMFVEEDGQRVMQTDGKPRGISVVVPKDHVRVLSNWTVVGLQSTGSFDFEIPEQDIPADWTFNANRTEPRRGSTIPLMGTLAVFSAGHSSVMLGMARRALHEAARIAGQKKRLYAQQTIAATEMFKIDFAKHDALYQAARALIFDRIKAAEQTALAGQPISSLQLQQIRQASIWAHGAALDVVNFAYRAVSSSLRKPSVLGTLLVDAAVGAQHIIADPAAMIDAGAAVIAQWAEQR